MQGRHTRESGYPVRRGFSAVIAGVSGILDRPLSRAMTAKSQQKSRRDDLAPAFV
jgi:hypothetical protein